jgi:hypothetical protein
MKTKLIAGFLLAGSCLFAAPRIAIGVGVGVPVAGYGYYAPAPAYVTPAPVYAAPAYVPPAPGVGFSFVAGFWGPGHVWHPGYWARRDGFVGPRGHFRR